VRRDPYPELFHLSAGMYSVQTIRVRIHPICQVHVFELTLGLLTRWILQILISTTTAGTITTISFHARHLYRCIPMPIFMLRLIPMLMFMLRLRLPHHYVCKWIPLAAPAILS